MKFWVPLYPKQIGKGFYPGYPLPKRVRKSSTYFLQMTIYCFARQHLPNAVTCQQFCKNIRRPQVRKWKTIRPPYFLVEMPLWWRRRLFWSFGVCSSANHMQIWQIFRITSSCGPFSDESFQKHYGEGTETIARLEIEIPIPSRRKFFWSRLYKSFLLFVWVSFFFQNHYARRLMLLWRGFGGNIWRRIGKSNEWVGKKWAFVT